MNSFSPRTLWRYLAPTVLLFIGASLPLHAENWPHWRGPHFDGSSPETNLPDHWSKTENVVWIAPLPGKSGSTPVVWGDTVFVSTVDAAKNVLLLAMNAADGQLRWKKIISELDRDAAKTNMSGPSPVTDGKIVVTMAGSGELAAFDFAGKELWKRNLATEFGHFAIMFYYSSSPLLYRGKLYIQVIQRNPPAAYSHAIDDKKERESFLLCLDPQTGKNVWRTIRETDATGESMDAYTSPVPQDGKIITFGAGFVIAHDAESGAEVWRCGSLNPVKSGFWRTIASPVTGPGFVYACVPRAKSPMVAIKTGGSGLVPESQIAWRYTEFSTDVPTPLYYNGKLFVLDGNKQMLTCLDPLTGEKQWQDNLGVREIFSASPTGADGKIYCLSDAGTVVVLSAGKEFKILASFKMEGEAAAAAVASNGIPIPSEDAGSASILTPIIAANGHLFVRTPQNLFCIGRK